MPVSPLRNVAEACAAGLSWCRRGRTYPVDEAVTLLFAGQDTATATLAWACHLLSLHPEVQAQLRRVMYLLHRHSDFWKNLHDFWPSRWTEEEMDEGRKRGAYMPFAVGQRN